MQFSEQMGANTRISFLFNAFPGETREEIFSHPPLFIYTFNNCCCGESMCSKPHTHKKLTCGINDDLLYMRHSMKLHLNRGNKHTCAKQRRFADKLLSHPTDPVAPPRCLFSDSLLLHATNFHYTWQYSVTQFQSRTYPKQPETVKAALLISLRAF